MAGRDGAAPRNKTSGAASVIDAEATKVLTGRKIIECDCFRNGALRAVQAALLISAHAEHKAAGGLSLCDSIARSGGKSALEFGRFIGIK